MAKTIQRDAGLMDEIVRRIVQAADPQKIILFGSRARGDDRPDSDLDLLVISESNEPRYRRSARESCSMRENADLVRGRLRKAQSDGTALEASVNAGAFDAACFHTQQAAEKYLKAFLTHARAKFPFAYFD